MKLDKYENLTNFTRRSRFVTEKNRLEKSHSASLLRNSGSLTAGRASSELRITHILGL